TRNQSGFTLTELVVALAIIGVMATAFTVTRAMITTSQVGNAVQGVETLAHGANQYLMTSGTAN
ncbi:MAG: prepilin-type N-terminal cleavage/methylation domain-containing protein, partial [Deltaproteobacteria bacterium]|nr:prepilin-type N-terminal cleavage/methylation domain-containing protein [Deltaproteobacteria bacterium]